MADLILSARSDIFNAVSQMESWILQITDATTVETIEMRIQMLDSYADDFEILEKKLLTFPNQSSQNNLFFEKYFRVRETLMRTVEIKRVAAKASTSRFSLDLDQEDGEMLDKRDSEILLSSTLSDMSDEEFFELVRSRYVMQTQLSDRPSVSDHERVNKLQKKECSKFDDARHSEMQKANKISIDNQAMDEGTENQDAGRMVRKVDSPTKLLSPVHKASKPLKPIAESSSRKTRGEGPSNANSSLCFCCKAKHHVSRCQEFLKFDVNLKKNLVNQSGACYNCLRMGHSVNDCLDLLSCLVCNQRHNTLLHETDIIIDVENTVSPPQPDQATSSNCVPPVNENAKLLSAFQDVLNHESQTRLAFLPTALICTYDANGTKYFANAILDSGSQSTFVTEKLVTRLQLERSYATKIAVHVLTDKISGNTRGLVSIGVSSRFTQTNYLKISAYVLPQLITLYPEHTNFSIANINELFELADPNVGRTREIDILFGADVFFDIFLPDKIVLSGRTYAQASIFGWILLTPQLHDGLTTSLSTTVNQNMARKKPTGIANSKQKKLKRACRVFTSTGRVAPIKPKSFYGAGMANGYMILFICFAYKTVHIQLFKDLSTMPIIDCLRGFYNVGGNYSNIALIVFSFNSTAKPPFGGLWKFNITSISNNVKRVTGDYGIPSARIENLLVPIKPLLSTQILYPVTATPHGLPVFTPQQFLYNDPNFNNTALSRLERPLNTEQFIAEFWEKWSQQYMPMHLR